MRTLGALVAFFLGALRSRTLGVLVALSVLGALRSRTLGVLVALSVFLVALDAFRPRRIVVSSFSAILQ